MSDNQSHEFVPPDEDDYEEDIADGDTDGQECQSCGDSDTGFNLVPCPSCGGDWCFDCFEEHIKEQPAHIQTTTLKGGEPDADDWRTSGELQETNDPGVWSGDEREDPFPDQHSQGI